MVWLERIPGPENRGRFGTLRSVPAVVFAALFAAGVLAAPVPAQSPTPPAARPNDGPAAAPSAAETAESARLVVVRFLTEGDFPPFNFRDEEGILTGFNVDLARAICLELNAACDIQERPWDDLLTALNRSEADAVIAAHAITPQALADVDFTDRYFHLPARFVAKRDAPAAEMTPEGLDGKRIGVAKGSSHEAYLRTFFRDSAIQSFDSADLARDGLLAGSVDYLFDDAVSLVFWLNGTLSRSCCEFRGGAFLEPRYFGDGIAIAVPRKDPQLRGLLNGALKRVRESGRYEELVQRYFPVRAY